jgi:wyosine [tRNA(Phe)-imidazoG37] synthetase (radical SAM superfamily)
VAKPRAGMLSTRDHDRDAAGFTYVYPVVSRRAGGVSVGINLNPNNACDWRCIYCQVPNLIRGTAPEIDLPLLANELRAMLDDIVHGDFMQRLVPEDCRQLRDIAISGNGEPTSSQQFADIVDLIGGIMRGFDLVGAIPLRLITNGSYMRKAYVQQGLGLMAGIGGEVWIKVDRASREGVRRVNGVSITPAQLAEQVTIAAGLCPTWIQSCMFAWDGTPPGTEEVDAYLGFLAGLQARAVSLRGVMLYGLARPSKQEPEAAHLSAVPVSWLQALARRIEAMGIAVSVHV